MNKSPLQSSEWLDEILKGDLAIDAYDTGYISPRAYPAFKEAILQKLKEAEVEAKKDENRYWIDRAGLPLTSTDFSNRIAELNSARPQGGKR